MPSKFPVLRIRQAREGGPLGRLSEITLDGVPLRKVTRIAFDAPADDVCRVAIEFYGTVDAVLEDANVFVHRHDGIIEADWTKPQLRAPKLGADFDFDDYADKDPKR